MKYLTYYGVWWILLGSLILFSSACTEEPAIESRVSVELISNPDSLEINRPVKVAVSATADFLTFYSGQPGKEFDSLPGSRGESMSALQDTLELVYTQAGSYKVVALASSYGNWGEQQSLAADSVRFSILDFETGISRVFITSPTYRIATIAGNTVQFNVGDIDLTHVTLQVITVSANAQVYPNGDESNAAMGGAEFTADYSGNDPHFIVESLGGTTEKFLLEFN